MIWIALKMLTGDRAKYFGIVFGVTFASLLMAHQVSIFVGIMSRCTSQVRDLDEADIWVMNPYVKYTDEVMALSDNDLPRVRGVEGVEWAVRLFKGGIRAKITGGEETEGAGNFRGVQVMGLDDATLIGAPREMILGDLADIRQPDAIIVDECGYSYLFPGQKMATGQIIEMNDRRAVLVGICKASPPFTAQAVIFTRYSQAMQFSPPERRLMSFVLVKVADGYSKEDVARSISERTGLKALTRREFEFSCVMFYITSTGIAINFGITVMLGFVVGIAIAGQTLYLFTIENIKQFGALKAMGTSNSRIVGMILTQSAVVGVLGYSIGMGLAAAFFEVTKNAIALKGFKVVPEVMIGTAFAVAIIVTLASLLSIRKVLVLEPAVVFR